MQRISLLVFGAFAVAVLSLVNAQDTTDNAPSYSVKFVLIGTDAEKFRFKDGPQLIKEGVSTDIPIQTTFEAKNGSIATYWGMRLYVPSPARMASPQMTDKTESVAVGPTLTCRIQRIDEARVLLDVTLTDAISTEHEITSGILKLTTQQLRSVQPVHRGGPVTLSWPAAEGVEKPRQVTITVLEPK
jgi:hypothetical protein